MSGSPYIGAYRSAPRIRRGSRFVADQDFDDSTQYAAYHAYPWATVPTDATAGQFGVNANNELAAADGLWYVPASGKRVFVNVTGNLTLVPGDAGKVYGFNVAAGAILTLPTARAGLFYEFHVDTTITSNAAKVITASASEFLLGWFVQATDGTYVTATHAANGSTIRAWSTNGSTTGGIVGDVFYVLGISATQWRCWGRGNATGAEATPFAIS